MVGVDKGLDDAAGTEDGGLEGVEVERIGLAEEEDLVAVLDSNDGSRAAAEAAIIDARNGGVVVGELRPNLRRAKGFRFRFKIRVSGGGGGGSIAGH